MVGLRPFYVENHSSRGLQDILKVEKFYKQFLGSQKEKFELFKKPKYKCN